MPVNIVCPCGHTVKIPDELVKTRIKCPVCGELFSTSPAPPENQSGRTSVPPSDKHASPAPAPVVPPKSATAGSSRPKATTMNSDQPATDEPSGTASSFHAKGGFMTAGLPIPSFFTKTSVTLLPERVHIKAAGLFSSRRLDLRLSEVTSVETRQCPDWSLFLLGVLLLPANGAGLILLIAFLFIRHSYLILKCGTATAAIRFNDDDIDACAIGDAILQAAQTA